MCRNIRTLYNFEPPATQEEIRAASLQFVRKISGMHSPSRVNQAAFESAVDAVALASVNLLAALQTNSPSRNRMVETEKARERSMKRFSNQSG